MRYLARLDVSNNQLTELLGLEPPPHNLQEIDFSRNLISDIPDLSCHPYLKAICLDRCRFLSALSLAENQITDIEGLDDLPIKYLNLSKNAIALLSGLAGLASLEDADLSHNRVASLQPLGAALMRCLRRLRLTHNSVRDLACLDALARAPLLTDLFLSPNPLEAEAAAAAPPPVAGTGGTALPPPPASTTIAAEAAARAYRLAVAFRLPRLAVLDGRPLSCEEKVAAGNLYAPPAAVVASLRHAAMMAARARLYARVKPADLLRATRLRPVVICGPSGAGKRTLTARLLAEYPSMFGLSVSHTTRRPRPGEVNGVHYHFVSRTEMQGMIDAGKFIEVVTLLGHTYGTSIDAVDKVTDEGKVCIMDLELEGVLALQRTHLKPHYVLIKPPSLAALEERLKARLGLPTAPQTGAPGDPHPSPAQPSQQRRHSLPRRGSAPGLPPSRDAHPGELDAARVPPLLPGERRRSSVGGSATGAMALAVAASVAVERAASAGPAARRRSAAGEVPWAGAAAAARRHIESDGGIDAEANGEVRGWLAKARRLGSLGGLVAAFDLEIVNDDEARAYGELRDFCHERVFAAAVDGDD
ncbi:hypothetical protein HK405_013616, partial [Cladochytrium tenue]